MGIFLGHDPVLGSFDTPPSLHRYLYANSNPFMYVDPTGRVAWLKKVADWFGDGADAAIDIASDLDFGDGTFANAAESYVAFSLGSLAGFQRAAQGAVSSVNFVSNVAVVSSGLAIRATGLGEADYAVGSLKELNQIEEDLGVAVDFAKEAAKNPGKVLHAAGSAVQEYAGRLASGDTRAIAQTSAFVTELVIDVATGNAAKKGAEALGEMGEAVAEQSVKQSKKARKASVLVEGKKTPKTAPKKVKAPDSPGGGSKEPTRGFQEYAKKDAAIQRQVRRAELDQKFGRSGDLNADINSGKGFSRGLTESSGYKNKPGYRLSGSGSSRRWRKVDPKENMTQYEARQTQRSVHGNYAGDQPAVLYAKFHDGQFRKWGVTQHMDPAKRYSGLGPLDEIRPMRVGPRRDILQQERRLTERFPGPDNDEPWAGWRNPGHRKYRRPN